MRKSLELVAWIAVLSPAAAWAGPDTAGDTRPSPRSCLVWREVTRVSPPQRTGEAEDAPAARRDRPLLVYVYDPKDPERYFLADTHESWRDWQVVVAGRLFERLRIPVEDARLDPALKQHAARRTLLFLRPDLTVVHAMSPRTSVRKLFEQMKRTVALDFTPSVDEIWERWQRNQDERWKTKREAAQLDGLLREAARTQDKRKQRELRERHRVESAKLAARLRLLADEEQRLYRLTAKEPAAAASADKAD